MENLRKRCNVELVTNRQRLQKLLRQPSLKRFYAIDDDLAIVERHRHKLVLDRPIYCGFVILGNNKRKEKFFLWY